MRVRRGWQVAVVIVAGAQLIACTQESRRPTATEPATVERIERTDISRVRLTARAVERIGIETVPVRIEQDSRAGQPVERMVVPYAAVLYDARGTTWTYTNPEPLAFVRERIEVDYIDGERAVLSTGPAPGTAVVAVGAAELYGTEFKVGH